MPLDSPPLTDIVLMLLLRRGSLSYDQLRRDLPHVSRAAMRMAVYTLRRSGDVQIEYAAGRHTWIIPPAACPLCGHPVDGGCE